MKHKFKFRATVYTREDRSWQAWPIYIFVCENCNVECRIHQFHFWGSRD